MNFPGKLFRNRKAQGINYVAVSASLLIFGILNMIFYAIFVQFITTMTASGLYTGMAESTGNAFLASFQTWDWLAVFLLVGLLIALGVSFFKIASSAIFFIITLILGIFWGFISYFFNYIFVEMISVPMLVTVQGIFPRTMLICTNLHWVSLACIIIGSITLYAKREKGQFIE